MLKTIENYFSPEKWSWSLKGSSRLQEVPTVMLWLGKLWCCLWDVITHGGSTSYKCQSFFLSIVLAIVRFLVKLGQCYVKLHCGTIPIKEAMAPWNIPIHYSTPSCDHFGHHGKYGPSNHPNLIRSLRILFENPNQFSDQDRKNPDLTSLLFFSNEFLWCLQIYTRTPKREYLTETDTQKILN